MASPRTIDHDEPFDDIDTELAHTSLFLLACPQTTALAPSIAALRADLPAVHALQAQHSDAVQAQEANAVFVDDEGNTIVDEVKVAALAEVKGDYRLRSTSSSSSTRAQPSSRSLSSATSSTRCAPGQRFWRAPRTRPCTPSASGPQRRGPRRRRQRRPRERPKQARRLPERPARSLCRQGQPRPKAHLWQARRDRHGQPAGSWPRDSPALLPPDTSSRTASTADVERTIDKLRRSSPATRGCSPR